MNIKHFDPRVVYPVKLKRIDLLIKDLVQAESHRLTQNKQVLQKLWKKMKKQMISSQKTQDHQKTENKGFLTTNMTLKDALQKMEAQLKKMNQKIKQKWQKASKVDYSHQRRLLKRIRNLLGQNELGESEEQG